MGAEQTTLCQRIELEVWVIMISPYAEIESATTCHCRVSLQVDGPGVKELEAGRHWEQGQSPPGDFDVQ